MLRVFFVLNFLNTVFVFLTVHVFRPATKDPLQDPQGPNIVVGFGGALTAALDVMAFTHDVDINGAAQGLNLTNNPKQSISPQQHKQVPTYKI